MYVTTIIARTLSIYVCIAATHIMSPSSQQTPPRDNYSDFCHHILVLLVFELNVDNLTQNVFLNIMSMRFI